jgi:hypothetical protein
MKTDKNSQTSREGAPSQPESAVPNTNPNAKDSQKEFFEPVIFTYTRKQALADGVQVEATKLATEAGFRIPVFLTASVYEQFVKVPEGVSGQDETGRLWDILWMLRYAISKARSDARRIRVELYVRNSDEKPAQLVLLDAEIGGVDFDDPRPCMTVMMEDED